MARLALCVVALCLAMALPAWSEKSRKGGGSIDKGGEEGDGEEVWLIHSGPANSREEYLNPLTGEVNGYHVDILNAVCEIAGVNCQLVYDVQNNCWDLVDGVQVGGFGLFNFYYDACIGWFPTFPRLRTFQFTESFSQNKDIGFFVPAGNSGNFDATDLSGKKIGFILGFFTDPSCVAMQGDAITGSDLSEDMIVWYANLPDLIEGVLNLEVDAGFDAFANNDELEFVNEDSPLVCANGGPAMMMRKDNRMAEWFNPALAQLLASDKYQEICDAIEGEHGDKPGPSRDEICL